LLLAIYGPQGMTIDELVKTYDGLTREQVEAV